MSDAIQDAEEGYWSLVEPIWRSISIYQGPDTFLRQFRVVRPESGYLFAAHWCQSEVRNGGLHQFFSNATGVLAPEALEGFGVIGLSEWSDILAEAMQFFGNPYPREREERREMLGPAHRRQHREPFDALDDRFFQWLKTEPRRWERAADAYAAKASLSS